MPSAKLATFLSASAPTITSPFHFIAVVAAWFQSLAGQFIDTPEERLAIENTIMGVYDDITRGLLATSPAIAALFVALRSWVKKTIDVLLVTFAPPPVPTPGPIVPPMPTGATP